MNRFGSGIRKGHHPIEKLSPDPAILGTVVDFDLDALDGLLLLGRESVPPLLEAIHHKVTGFTGTAKGQVQLPTILVEDTEGRVGFFAAHVMVTRLGLASGLAASRILANVDGRFSIHTQAFDLVRLTPGVFGVEGLKDGVGFWDFFCGLALTTLRKRYPIRFKISAIVLAAGNCSSLKP